MVSSPKPPDPAEIGGSAKSPLFVVTPQALALSDEVMSFNNLWIYDLKNFHPLWRTEIMNLHPHFGGSPWQALLKAYEIHTFSPLSRVQKFAEDYHVFFRTQVSRRQIEKFFMILNRLGLQKYGHLLRLNPADIQKRFGVVWRKLFEGLTQPLTTPWPWKKYRERSRLTFKVEEEFCLYPDANLICERLRAELEKLPALFIEQIELKFALYESPEDICLNLQFSEILPLPRERAWLFRLLEERIFQLQIPEALSAIHINLYPVAPSPALQLSLFEKSSRKHEFSIVINRLRDQGFELFQPKILPSHIPERSWTKEPAQEYFHEPLSESFLLRPLWMSECRPIPPPQTNLQFHERIEWFDEVGHRHRRDYYIAHRPQRWVWIFCNEADEWFEQGIVE